MHGGKKQKPSPVVFKSQKSLLIEGILFGIIIDRTHHWGNQTQMLFQEKELFEVKTFVPSSQVLEAQKNVEPLWLLISYQSLFQSEFFSTITFAFFIRSYSKLYISVGIRQSRSPTLCFNVILTNFVLFLNFILQGINDY